ncbi:MAG: nucleotidyl transferase AbiEii/AbiGii toxin family protein [Candidatus Competibacteraceae bacterium]|nr:nucleotidyl transferase AbiEii/AbiGii toxin family protein [Candidatus Competibacteraceae bacterium]
MDLLLELTRLTQALDRAGIDYALCGGLALAVYARPRATLDIDLMVEPEGRDNVRKTVEPQGFVIAALDAISRWGGAYSAPDQNRSRIKRAPGAGFTAGHAGNPSVVG